ncbi:transmembrane protein 59-like [Heterocephalus glaber]|uniref:Transmembrane protein 59 n=1 Tax=Heterocephalus glaber TaxID=10181 RepID=A0AAX6QX73_HETGA|nr:transmembrane protein 59-like [Heterocephalus glaber]
MTALKGNLWVRVQLGLPLLLLLTMALAGGSGTASAKAVNSVLGDTASCHRACQLTYPLHTYPKEEEQEQLMSLMPKMHLLFPLILVWSFWSDMMGSAQSFITSSWTFYLQANDGKILIFQSKPEIQYAPQLEQGPTNLRKSSLSKMSSDLQMRSSQAHRNYLEDGFLRCLSVNSKWILTIILILAIILILSVMVLLWICCAAVATAVEQYIPSEKLSIYGDLKFMNEQKLSRYPVSSPVVIRSKTEDHEEAGPLPTKMNLVHSEIKDFFFKENSHRHLNFHSS